MWQTIALVARREYLKVIRRKSFWLSTLMLPSFILLVSFVSGYSAQQSEKNIQKQAEEAKQIWVVDNSGWIKNDLLAGVLQLTTDEDRALADVKSGQADALIIYPEDVALTKSLTIYAQSEGFIGNTRFNELAKNLLRQSIQQEIGDPDKIAILNTDLLIDVQAFENGEPAQDSAESLLIPIFSIFAYFVMTSFGVSFFLMSVAEEKENRMMEIVLSAVKAKDLIWGKIIGLLGIVFTQFLILLVLGGAIIAITNTQLPFALDLSKVDLKLEQVLLGLFYLFSGFLFLASVMVGVGAAMPNYKDASSFSSVFIILSIFPIYFAAAIFTDPSGPLATALSFAPFTAPMILIFRNAIGELPLLQQLISIPVMLGYIVLSFILAFKLFEIGSLEYTDKLNFKRILNRH